MVKPVGQAISAAIEATKLRETTQKRVPATTSAPVSVSAEESNVSPIARLAAQGAPIDIDKVSRIKSAIASGNYPVDPEKIANSIVELDLPSRAN